MLSVIAISCYAFYMFKAGNVHITLFYHYSCIYCLKMCYVHVRFHPRKDYYSVSLQHFSSSNNLHPNIPKIILKKALQNLPSRQSIFSPITHLSLHLLSAVSSVSPLLSILFSPLSSVLSVQSSQFSPLSSVLPVVLRTQTHGLAREIPIWKHSYIHSLTLSFSHTCILSHFYSLTFAVSHSLTISVIEHFHLLEVLFTFGCRLSFKQAAVFMLYFLTHSVNRLHPKYTAISCIFQLIKLGSYTYF